jgi:pyrimidine deaminase RibD-like protein
MAVTVTPDEFMRLALAEGLRALPACLPNPPVGAVIVRNGEVLALGYTQAPGKPHAEVMALAQVKGDLADAHLYVTLEPCSFHGRTPSCAEALIARGLRTITVALLDPDPRNAGRGIERLRAGGVAVFLGLLAAQAHQEIGPYLNLPANRGPVPDDTAS